MTAEWGNWPFEKVDLAALLDGEVEDGAQAEAISLLIAGDASLQAEYEEQRAVKLALAQVEEYEVQPNMSERVLASIAATRSTQTVSTHAVSDESLAGLLDGQLTDTVLVEKLSTRVASDSGLMAAFEEQRMVKKLLGGLPEYSEPQYMSTRVLAGIEEKRKLQGSTGLSRLRLAMGGAALFVGGFLVALQFVTPLAQRAAPVLADGHNAAAGMVIPVGLDHQTDALFSDLPSNNSILTAEQRAMLPAETVLYLETLKEAHSNSRFKSYNNTVSSPDMGNALLVLDLQGGR